MTTIALRKKEFFDNVWDHSTDPFQMQFDERRPLNAPELSCLREVVRLSRTTITDEKLGAALLALLIQAPDNLFLLLQLCGLTRNKIITDLRATAKSSGSRNIPTTPTALLNDRGSWDKAGPYLAGWTRRVFAPLPADTSSSTFEALNQATWPGFIRQERAKRSGHEAEHRLATLLLKCGIAFVPMEKIENPLCRDIIIHDVSFDIVVPDIKTPLVCVKATTHTSNIGQFGESKDHLELDEARRMLDTKYPGEKRPILIAFVDGVGFTSNIAGLEGVLKQADEFCQFKTIWKAVVVCFAKLKRTATVVLPDADIAGHKAFLQRHGFLDKVVNKVPAGAKVVVQAGAAIIITT